MRALLLERGLLSEKSGVALTPGTNPGLGENWEA